MIEEEVTDGTDRPTSSANASSSNADVSGDVDSVSSPEVSHDDDHLMCRVCRGNDGHLFYPCRCTGSIKYVHQECLTEWLKYSKKEVCELCNYKYSFQAIYRADMPKALPIRDIVRGLAVSSGRMIKTWLLYSIVLIAWLGLVPLTACRIYNIVFYTSSINELTTYPSILFRTDNVFPDVIKGGCLLAIFVCTFISLVWLREQIIHGGPQDFLDIARNQPVAAADVLGENRNEANRLDGFRQLEERDQDWRENDDLPDDYHMEETDEESDTDSQPGFEFHREERLDEQEDEEESGEEGDALPRIEHNDEQNGRNEDAVNAGEDNWRDWDRLGDELTWQRLLGLDGSLVFLEHVFWVISLNTLFTVIFAYLPYRLGFYALGQLGAMEHIHYFPSVAAIIAGYFMLAFFLYGVHSVCGFFRWKILFRLLGIGFLVLKVFLLVLLEIGLFPIICGSWIDLCSMSMFSSTLSSRVSSFTQSPVMQVFVRWLVGMVYVFYSASFVILLREVLRPGVLWFLRNLNDPEFNPIQEMIDLPVSRHIQRIVASTTLFFTTIFLIVYLPLNIIKSLIPTTLPYNVSWTADTPLSELSLELLVLQVLLPALLEQTQARVVLREAIKLWCQTVGKALDLDGFLLPEEDAVIPPAAQQPQPNAEQAGGGLAAEHQALLLIREPQGAPHPYTKPSWFALRIFALLGCMGTTWTLFSTLCFFVPVTFGRVIIRTATGLQNVHDLYTTGCGLYVIWSIMRIGLFFYDWFKMETVEMQNSVKMCFSLLIRCSSIIIPSIIIVPFLLGTFFQLVFVGPLRLDSNQTALTFLWQDWAMGVLHLKIVLAVVMMGPEWWLRTACDRIYQDGFRNLRATRIMCVVVLPVILSLASAIAIPHLLAVLIATVTGASSTQLIVIHRLCYPICAVITLTVSFACWQYNKFKGLADTIRNEKYLVGTRLINYEREAKKNN